MISYLTENFLLVLSPHLPFPDSPWMGKSPRNNQLSEVEVVKNLWNGTLFFVHIARRDALGGHLSWKHLQIDWQKPEPVSAMMVHVHYFGVV